MQQIDLSVAYTTLERIGANLVAAVPRLLVAIVVLVVLYLAGNALRLVFMRGAHGWRGRRNLELVIGRVLQAAVVAISTLVAATIAFPSFTAAGLIQLLGVSGIAIGFAFKDIFQNFLAGILLLITEPFSIGDEISVAGYEGTVEDIQTRATTIITYDHRRVVVPNADLFTKSVTVNTAFNVRRTEYDITLPADVDVEAVKGRIVERVNAGIEGVALAPPADVLLVKFDATGVTLRVRWWSSPERSVNLEVQDRVLRAVREAVR